MHRQTWLISSEHQTRLASSPHPRRIIRLDNILKAKAPDLSMAPVSCSPLPHLYFWFASFSKVDLITLMLLVLS
ncbi:hypothetical protein HHX47_DHR6000788 [Lentinula edodes]|nr:hypothetical protein HHX47_DHR6000788 [Lentinula edodes]